MPSTKLVTIGEALRSGASLLLGSETPQLDARILLKSVLKLDDGGLIARSNEMLTAADSALFQSLLTRRAANEPIAYITGIKEFWSLEFKVTPDVLIPRDDSGTLIEAAKARRGPDEALRIVDLGTGSGCLLCALLSEFCSASGVGVDQSLSALRVAKANAQALGFSERAEFVAGDWLSPLKGEFDIVIANPPYIPESERKTLARDVADYEPSSALFAGEDELDAYRDILKGLSSHLAEDALVIMECGADQADSLTAILEAMAPVNAIFTMKDLAGRPRGAGFDLRKRKKGD